MKKEILIADNIDNIYDEICVALVLKASRRIYPYFRTRFSWVDHIFTTNSWKNIFVWEGVKILVSMESKSFW